MLSSSLLNLAQIDRGRTIAEQEGDFGVGLLYGPLIILGIIVFMLGVAGTVWALSKFFEKYSDWKNRKK